MPMSFHRAAEIGDFSLCVRLLQTTGGFDPENPPAPVVIPKALRELVNCFNDEGFTPLHLAAKSGHLDVCRLLLNMGAEQIEGKRKKTPLHMAARYGCASVCRLLVSVGADINAQDNANQTSVLLAAASGHQETVQTLVELGADVNIHLGLGTTVLHLVTSEDTEITRILIKGGGHVNAQDAAGKTPLHVAARSGTAETIRLLLEAGADPWILDSHDKIPLSYIAPDRADLHALFEKFMLERTTIEGSTEQNRTEPDEPGLFI